MQSRTSLKTSGDDQAIISAHVAEGRPGETLRKLDIFAPRAFLVSPQQPALSAQPTKSLLIDHFGAGIDLKTCSSGVKKGKSAGFGRRKRDTILLSLVLD